MGVETLPVGLTKLGVGSVILALAWQLVALGSAGITENIQCFECWIQLLIGAVIGAAGVWAIMNGWIEMNLRARSAR